MEVQGFGPKTARYAIIGEAPGAEERRQGRPFVGPSGQLLRDALIRVGLDPDDAYITNVYKEYRYGNPTPSTKEINESRQALYEELSEMPNLEGILLLGNVPLRAVTGRTGITKQRGRANEFAGPFAELDADGVAVFATLHPAAILRNVRNKSDWLNDLSTFAALLNGTEEEVEIHIIDNWHGLKAMEADMVLHKGIGALDVETTIADRLEDVKLLTVAVTFDGKKAYVLRYDTNEFRQGLPILARGKWIMHNGSFDLTMLHAYCGYPFTLYQDTMAMAYLLHPEERKGLELLSGVYLGLPPYKGIDYKNIESEPLDELAAMNGRDACRTFNLFRPLANELNERPHLSRTYQWLLLPAIQALSAMTIRGVPLDMERVEALKVELEADLARLRADLIKLAGKPTDLFGRADWPKGVFNPGSPQQVAHVLFDKLGYPVLAETSTGAPSTGADILEQLSTERPSEFLDKLLEYRTANKLLTAFINSWTDLVESDGRLHPRYKPTQVVTGRLAAEKPNIQQVPRQGKIREVFGGVPGFVWVKADLSQIELRIAAWLANEERMLQAYRDGVDLHAITARAVLGIEDVTQEWKPGKKGRDAGKMLNFSLLYGAYPAKLVEIARRQYGLTISNNEAEEYRGLFFDTYPGLARWHAEVKAEVRSTGMIESPLGRVRSFPEVNDPDEWVVRRAEREAINHPVQSFASDLLLSSLVRLPPEIQRYAIAEVHDELDFLVPEGEVELVIPVIKGIMEDTSWLKRWGIELGVPVVAEVEAKGTHWQ